MDLERLKEYRKRLAKRATPDTFIMSAFVTDGPTSAHACGTAACVAGYLPRLFPAYASYCFELSIGASAYCRVDDKLVPFWDAAKNFLDLTRGQATYLFNAEDAYGRFRDDSPNALADALHRMDWLIANPNSEDPWNVDAPDFVPGNEPPFRDDDDDDDY